MKILTDDEIVMAQKIIDAKSSGVYELKQLFGPTLWRTIECPNDYGTRFKGTVDQQRLVGIRRGKPKTNNHQTYEICK